jgi:HAMP domain-containing protein
MKLNIQTKLLIVFMTVFAVLLLGVFYWFYQFSTTQMMNELRQTLIVSASTAANSIDAAQHTRLFESGTGGDADYQAIAKVLESVRDANPRVTTAYTAVYSPDGSETELVFVVEAGEDVQGESYDASDAPEMLQAFNGPIADATIGEDEYGNTLSGYAPILDGSGNAVAIVGVDMDASDVIAAQGRIRTTSILVFLFAFAALFAAVTLVSGAITKPLIKITDAARILENDQPYDPKQLEELAKGKDELGILAHVFNIMAEKVYKRQEKLKQEVAQLRIEIDQSKRDKEVADIVDSDFFKELKAKSQAMRQEHPPEDDKKE